MSAIRLLVVDDDPLVLRALGRMLREHADVYALTAPRAALDAPEVDLALLDVDMPDLSGWDLADALAARRPGLPILFMTGRWPRPVPTAWQGAEVLSKPFDVPAVLAALRRARR